MLRLQNRSRSASGAQGGNALVIASIAIAVLGGVSVAALQVGLGATSEQRGNLASTNAQLAAEAAITASLVDIQNGGDGRLFDADNPLVLGSSRAWIRIDDSIGDRVDVESNGSSELSEIGLEVVYARTSSSVFQFGAFGEEGLLLESNARVDSYDSGVGPYTALSGSGSSAYGSPNGTIGSNGDIVVSQNAKVWGNVQPGPGQSGYVLGNATVSGSVTSSAATMELPEIEVPAVTTTVDYTTGNNSSGVIWSGTQGFKTLDIGKQSTVTIVGPATLVVGAFRIQSGAELIIDAAAGPVEIIVLDDFLIDSNTLLASTTKTPADLTFNLLSDNIIDPLLQVDLDEVDFDSNAVMYGTVLAPNAAIEINSNFILHGAIAALSLQLDSNCQIHYDEALANSSSAEVSQWESVGWRVKGFEAQ